MTTQTASLNMDRYQELVYMLASLPSKNLDSLIESLTTLTANNPTVNIPLLITAGIGMTSESGEFLDIVKKLVFQGKTLESVKADLCKELGDVAWYWTNACNALGVSPNDILKANIEKLEARYKNYEFSVEASEERDE